MLLQAAGSGIDSSFQATFHSYPNLNIRDQRSIRWEHTAEQQILVAKQQKTSLMAIEHTSESFLLRADKGVPRNQDQE